MIAERSFLDLVSMGVYEVAGFDDDGETLYALNPDVAREVAPDIYAEEMARVQEAIQRAIEDGYLGHDMGIDPEGNLSSWLTIE